MIQLKMIHMHWKLYQEQIRRRGECKKGFILCVYIYLYLMDKIIVLKYRYNRLKILYTVRNTHRNLESREEK